MMMRIGSVTIALPSLPGDPPRAATATLHEDGRWGFAGDRDAATSLKHCLWAQDLEYGGPADGPSGHRILSALAAHYGVEPHFEARAPMPPGTVY